MNRDTRGNLNKFQQITETLGRMDSKTLSDISTSMSSLITVITDTFEPKTFVSALTAASVVVKASEGILYSAVVYNKGAVDQYLQVFNLAALPANGTAPLISFPLPPRSLVTIPLGNGREFSTGIVLCNSTTSDTKTLGAADCSWDICYE